MLASYCDSRWGGTGIFGGLATGGYWGTSSVTVGMFLAAWGWGFNEHAMTVGA